jgi:hypothetical protein
MTDPRPEIDASLARLNALARRGRAIRHDLDGDPANALAAARVWQHDCAAEVSQLSGGSKMHWLSRAYSNALLVRAADGGAVAEAPVTDIVERVLDVLDHAAQSLMQPDALHAALSAAGPPSPRRFEFVHDQALRSVLEQAYAEGARELDEGDYTRSLMTSCSAIEALLTDALGGSEIELTSMSFAERIAAAEQRGLIRGGCARLPDVARDYRIAGEAAIVTQRDARVARQVLHVVMRDLDPGR